MTMLRQFTVVALSPGVLVRRSPFIRSQSSAVQRGEPLSVAHRDVLFTDGSSREGHAASADSTESTEDCSMTDGMQNFITVLTRDCRDGVCCLLKVGDIADAQEF